MSSHVIFFVALIAAIDLLNKVESVPAEALDINKVLELVQQQRLNTGISKQRRLRLRRDSSDSDSDSDDYYTESDETDESDNNRYAKLGKDRIIDLVETVANENNNRLRNNDRITYHKSKPNYGQNSYISRSEKYDNVQGNNAQILEKIFSQGFKHEERKAKPTGDYTKKRLKPSRLLPLPSFITKNKVSNYYNQYDDTTGLEDYSKVYIVLNPQAVRKSKNKNALNDLISKVLSLSSPTSKKDRQVKRKPLRYKGFIINEDHLKKRSRLKDSNLFGRTAMP